MLSLSHSNEISEQTTAALDKALPLIIVPWWTGHDYMLLRAYKVWIVFHPLLERWRCWEPLHGYALINDYMPEQERERKKEVVHLLPGKRFNTEDTHWSKVQNRNVSIFDDKQMVASTW